MIRSRTQVQLPQSIIRSTVIVGILLLLLAGFVKENFQLETFHSPIPEGYTFEVQAAEAELTPAVTTTPSPTPTESPTKESLEEMVTSYIKTKDWPVEEALAIAKCESGYYDLAIGDKHITFEEEGVVRGYSVGIFQIRMLKGRPSLDTLLNFQANIDYAYEMWKTQGWTPWSCKSVLNH